MNRVDSSAYICMHVAIQLQAPIGLLAFLSYYKPAVDILHKSRV